MRIPCLELALATILTTGAFGCVALDDPEFDDVDHESAAIEWATCAEGKVYFDGSCRGPYWVKNNLLSTGSTFMAMDGPGGQLGAMLYPYIIVSEETSTGWRRLTFDSRDAIPDGYPTRAGYAMVGKIVVEIGNNSDGYVQTETRVMLPVEPRRALANYTWMPVARKTVTYRAGQISTCYADGSCELAIASTGGAPPPSPYDFCVETAEAAGHDAEGSCQILATAGAAAVGLAAAAVAGLACSGASIPTVAGTLPAGFVCFGTALTTVTGGTFLGVTSWCDNWGGLAKANARIECEQGRAAGTVDPEPPDSPETPDDAPEGDRCKYCSECDVAYNNWTQVVTEYPGSAPHTTTTYDVDAVCVDPVYQPGTPGEDGWCEATPCK